jgi:hypothetical protein
MKAYYCVDCGEKFKLEVNEEQLERIKKGELVQNVLPNLTADERELMISGYCGKCFDNLFIDDDDDIDEDDEDEDDDEFIKAGGTWSG